MGYQNDNNFWKLFFKIAGSSILISMACLDPGNLEGDMELSYRMGYSSLWVLLFSHFVLFIYQDSALKLSTVLGYDLSSCIRIMYPKPLFILLWVTTEIALISGDIQAILGAAISMDILLNINKYIAVLAIILIAIAILYIQEVGQKVFESIFAILLMTMIITFAVIFFMGNHNIYQISKGFIPNIPNKSLTSIIGIIGAVIVPQNLYLQSGLVLTRDKYDIKTKTKLKIFRLETAIIIVISFIVNLFICCSFTNFNERITLRTAADHIATFLSKSAATLYLIGVMASGLSSATSGALCGQIILNGFLDIKISQQKRNLISRTITVAPCLLVLYYLNVDNILSYLNIIQFIQLPFAIIPLVKILKNKELLGKHSSSNAEIFIIIVFTIILQLFYIFGISKIISTSSISTILLIILLVFCYYSLIFYMILHKLDNINAIYKKLDSDIN